jgi:hypothetical protein
MIKITTTKGKKMFFYEKKWHMPIKKNEISIQVDHKTKFFLYWNHFKDTDKKIQNEL